jgi:hypothetical protein
MKKKIKRLNLKFSKILLLQYTVNCDSINNNNKK